jgi:hypothetical protein
VTDGRLDLPDRVREPERLLLGGAENVEREPLRGALADAGKAAQLGDEAVDGGGEQSGSKASRGLGRLAAAMKGR